MIGLVPWAIFGLLIIMVMAIVSNTGQTATANIQQLMDRLGCPMPEGNGLWNSSGTITHTNATYNWPNAGGGAGAQPIGNLTNGGTLTCTEVHTLDGVDYYFGQPAVAIGVFFYVNDYISELFGNKVTAVFTMIAYVLAPINFDVFGFTIADLSGVALMLVIGLYVFSYIPIGILIYKAISPFTGL